MPRLINPGAGDAITLSELVDALADCRVDVRDEDAFAALGPLLARLGRNRDFLADMALGELKQRCAGQAAINGYGPQVFLLHPPANGFVLRANFWPARDDWVMRASGAASFFYDFPHDHNFPFLTVGYLGPGYWSDYYEVEPDTLSGLPGDPAGLRFVERSRLEPGKLMLYRMRRDVHAQLPPDAFSVSLNILGYDVAQPWIDQHRFDTLGNRIAERLTIAPSEALLTLAVRLGAGNGEELARHFMVTHPSERMRVTAMDALAGMARGGGARAAIYEAAARSGGAMVRGTVALRLARESGPERSE